MTKWSQLEKWQPTLADIKKISHDIFEQFANSTVAEKVKKAGDDWLTHAIYFIRCRAEN
jgi:hypothetical protein